MKRLATLAGLAIASILGAFSFSAPAHATTPVTCTSPTSGGLYPQGFLWICNGNSTVANADILDAQAALGHLGGVGTSVASNAKDNMHMATNQHYIYVFASDADYDGTNKYCTTTGNVSVSPPVPKCNALSSNEVALTSFNGPGGAAQTVIITSRVHAPGVVNTNMASTTAHEAGHHLDKIYGSALYGAGEFASKQSHELGFKLTGLTATFQGTFTSGDTVSITFQGTLLPTPVVITHTVPSSGESFANITSDFVTKINGNASLTAAGINVHATAASPKILVTSDAILNYSTSTTGANHLTAALSLYDWPAFNKLTPCAKNTGIFSKQQDVGGNYICSALDEITLGGTPTTNDIVSVSIDDPDIDPSFNPRPVGYLVKSTDNTAAKVAAGLAAVINADPKLMAAHITATNTVGSNIIRVSLPSNDVASFTVSTSIGATETITASGVTLGNGETKADSYRTLTYNDAVLKQAWPHYFDDVDSPFWAELMAEETAVIASQNVSGNRTQFHYIDSGNFICSKNFVNSIEKTGAVPKNTTPTNFPYSSLCQ